MLEVLFLPEIFSAPALVEIISASALSVSGLTDWKRGCSTPFVKTKTK